MNLDEILALFDDPAIDNWEMIADVHHGEEDGHYYRAVFRPDVRISLEWGRSLNDDFKEDWVKFADPHASSSLADIMFNGAIVRRVAYVIVDGGRCSLPMPTPHFKEKEGVLADPEIDYYSVKTWDVAFVRLLYDVSHPAHVREFDSYLKRAGFRVE